MSISRIIVFFALLCVGLKLPLSAYTPVHTLNGETLPYVMEGNVKVFHLTAEPIPREFAPGLIVNCWGYNGKTPGPTIEAVEGDTVRILVTNHLPAPTSVHWHGIILPNGMDGVAGLTEPAIKPGETFAYQFILKQSGTCMYHSHCDEMTQIAMGLVGFFIIHPKQPETPAIDKDYAIMLQEWFIPIGGSTPNPIVMLDFNYFTFNGKVFPATEPLVIQQGDRVRIRFGNLSMDNHPIHLHGFRFTITGTGAGSIPQSARYQDVTVDVPVGSTRDIEFIADNPGDWLLHCHKSHHMMNGMTHTIPNMLGVKQKPLLEKMESLIPGYMPMGEIGMEHAHEGPRPRNTLPHLVSLPYGHSTLGGMATVVKVRENISENPGWYQQPPGTSVRIINLKEEKQ